MKYTTATLALAGVSSARMLYPLSRTAKREVPQEHSHEPIVRSAQTNLQLDNPLEIQDAVFALLGNAAAAEGAPNVENLDCLQQIVADQAFTNAKAADDVAGMEDAVLFRALERNTGSVGLESVLCNETATNPEIDAVTQHQDPASDGAAALNKEIALEVARQISSFGGDPLRAIESGTFEPGNVDDATGAGNTCDDPDDEEGCIISLGLLVPDVTEEEINAAIADAGAGAGAGADAGADADAGVDAGADADTDDSCAADDAADDAAGDATGDAADDAAGDGGAATGTNVQTFTGTLGGAAPPVVSSNADKPFSVNGATFLNAGAALSRSCAVQHNACADAANSGGLDGGVQQCDEQEAECNAASASARRFRKARRQALDFGSCADPSIQFAAGLDNRAEESFAPSNAADFSHGSALNIAVISSFICQQLESACKASAETVETCNQADEAAQANEGQAAADTFNSALGL